MQDLEEKSKTKNHERRSRKRNLTNRPNKKHRSVSPSSKVVSAPRSDIERKETVSSIARQLQEDGLALDVHDKAFLEQKSVELTAKAEKTSVPLQPSSMQENSLPTGSLAKHFLGDGIPDRLVEQFGEFLKAYAQKEAEAEEKKTKCDRNMEEISKQMQSMHVEETQEISDPFPDRYSDADPEYANVMDGQMPLPRWGDLAFAEPVQKKKLAPCKPKNFNCGVFFGTFDPIHDNHVRLFKYALENHIDALYLIVNEESNEKEISAPLFHRKLMVTERLLEDDLRSLNIHMFTPRKKCGDWYGRNGVSSAIHQMEVKKNNCPVAMFQIIGEDSFFRTSAINALEKLSRTHGINRSFLVFPRLAPLPLEQVEPHRAPQNAKISYKVIAYRDPYSLSSTQVRVALNSLCELRLCIDYQEIFDKMKNRLHKTTVIYINNFKLYHSSACLFQKEPKMVEVD